VPEGIGRQVGLPMGSGLTRSGLRSFGLILTDHLCGIRHTRHIGLEDGNIHSFLKKKEEELETTNHRWAPMHTD
jgi:hypothetical protein